MAVSWGTADESRSEERRVHRWLPLFLALVVACAPPISAPSPSPATPTPAAPTSTVPASRSAPAATASPPTAATSAEQLADALADALRRSDYARLQTLITPKGWFGAFYRGGGSAPLTPPQTVDWLRLRTRSGSIEAVVSPRPILSPAPNQTPGDAYIRSTWMNFAEFTTMNVELELRNESGMWFWSGALFNAPNR